MNTEQFIDRVIPTDSPYFCFAYRAGGMKHRFWPRDQVRAAANWMRHVADTTDVYIAVAGYKEPTRRIADNVHSIQCFFVDADIKRDGDGKDPDKVYADNDELVNWVGRLHHNYGLQWPNLWIGSGYGFHLYWVFDEPMEPAYWISQAAAFKQLLVESGGKGDLGVSGDIARILRPVGSFNYKVPDNPRQCLQCVALGGVRSLGGVRVG